MTYPDEAQLEIVTADYFRELDYEYVHGPQNKPALSNTDGAYPMPPRLSQRST